MRTLCKCFFILVVRDREWNVTYESTLFVGYFCLFLVFVCLFVCSFFLFYLWGCEVMCQWFNWICGGVGFLRSGVFPFQNRDITCCLFKLSLEWSLDFQGKVILVLCSRTWMANFFYLTFTFAIVIDFFCWETSLHEI